MKQVERNKVIELLNKIFSSSISEADHRKINEELDLLISDPNWTGYIFWSNEYFTESNGVNYDKFFQKISEYENSEEYKRNKNIISLVKDLLHKNFQEKSEVTLINELHFLMPNCDWIDCLFVSKDCFSEDGKFNEKEFLRAMGLINFEDSSLTYLFEHD